MDSTVKQPVREMELQDQVGRKERRIVAICGTAGSSRNEIMEAPADWELWGLSKSYTWMPRVDVIFEMHERAHWPHVYTPDHVAWMAQQTAPIYTQRVYPDIPASVRFPFTDVLEGRYDPYFTSTIAYMLALAIHQRVDEIRLLGVNMSTDSEHGYQRGACEYWLGIARATGITVYLPEASPLTKGLLYGRESSMKDMDRKLKDWEDRLKQQLIAMQDDFVRLIGDKLKDLQTNITGCHGALQLIEKMRAQGQGEQDSALLVETIEDAVGEVLPEEPEGEG